MNTFNSNTHEKGFTLVELMVSMTLGLVISLAAIQLFLTGFSSYNLQRGVGDVNENGRFALDFIASNLRQYQPDATNSGSIVLSALNIPGGSSALVSFNDLSNAGVGIGRSDQLVAKTWVSDTNPNYRDCEGNLVPVNNYSIARYFLRADVGINSRSALACDAGYYNTSSAAVTNYGDPGVVLLASVDSFQVLYGISAIPVPADGSPIVPVRYVPSNLVGSSVVAAVRLGVLVNSSESVGGFVTAPLGVNVLDVPISSASLATAGANRIRRVFTSTIALRNVM